MIYFLDFIMKVREIFLVNPPALGNMPWKGGKEFKHPPIGLEYIAATLERNLYQVKIIDLETQKSGKKLEEIITEFFYKCKEEKPDIVGVSILDRTIYSGKQLCKTAKMASPQTKVIVGGITPTANPDLFLKENYIDIIVRGEGEYTTLEIVENLKKGKNFDEIRGIIYRNNNKVVYNPFRELIENLDDLQFPAHHLIVPDNYDLGGISTSRGCYHNCTFCSIKVLYGSRVRKRNIKGVIDELDMLINKYHFRHINFTDDNFMQDPERVENICSRIIEVGLNKNCTFEVEGRVDDVSKNSHIIKKMREAGFIYIFLGGESGSQSTLDYYRKRITPEQTIKAIEVCRKYDIVPKVNFILCSPIDSKEDIIKTVDIALESMNKGADIRITPLVTPYYGTEIYKKLKDNEELEIIQEIPRWTPKDSIIKDALISLSEETISQKEIGDKLEQIKYVLKNK